MKDHHEAVTPQVNDPLRFVGQIAERVLEALQEGADTIAAAVGSLEIEPQASIALPRTDYRLGRVPDQAGLEISTHPGAHGQQDRAANQGLAESGAARQFERQPGQRPKYGRGANKDRLVDSSS